MNVKLRISISGVILFGVVTGLYFLIALLGESILYWTATLFFFILFLFSLIRWLGTQLTITEDSIYYQRFLFWKSKVKVKEITSITIKKGKIRRFLEIISNTNSRFIIYPFFSVPLVDIQSLILGKPFDREQAQRNIDGYEKSKRKGVLIVIVLFVTSFLGVFTYRWAVMNHAKVQTVYIVNPDIPSEQDLEDDYSLFVSEISIQTERDAGNAALKALSSELNFLSKLLNNTYNVYYDQTGDYYFIYKFDFLNDCYYYIYIQKGDNLVYFKLDSEG